MHLPIYGINVAVCPFHVVERRITQMHKARLPCPKLTLRVSKGLGMAARMRAAYTEGPPLRGYTGEFGCLILM